ncbi:hypothetical protein EDB19DRAFT_1828730 [Suillus lakei]|nr:hypothetical protein EDB19DRAFT_1828730 [Suillus lakei]
MLPSEDAKVFSCLYRLYLLTSAESALVDLLSVGLICYMGAGDPTQNLHLAINALCLEVLPNAIGLSDAFGFSDWSLDSTALGVFDGHVYKALWQRLHWLLLPHDLPEELTVVHADTTFVITIPGSQTLIVGFDGFLVAQKHPKPIVGNNSTVGGYNVG